MQCATTLIIDRPQINYVTLSTKGNGMDIRDFFFQLVLFFAGAAIGIIAAILPRNRLKWTGGILSACFVITSLIWLGYEFGVGKVNPPELVAAAPTPASPVTQIIACKLPNGEVISADSLARVIGGEAQYWTPRGENCVWGYWNKDVMVNFHHPGGNTILTYWYKFEEPRNSRGCWVVVPAKNSEWDGETRTIQCPEPGAEFNADGIGFHPIP
jgi:hypothetical protein